MLRLPENEARVLVRRTKIESWNLLCEAGGTMPVSEWVKEFRQIQENLDLRSILARTASEYGLALSAHGFRQDEIPRIVRHERAHHERSHSLKVGATYQLARFPVLEDSQGAFVLPCVRLNTLMLERQVGGSSELLRRVVGSITGAPGDEGVGYPLEEQIAQYLLGEIAEKPRMPDITEEV